MTDDFETPFWQGVRIGVGISAAVALLALWAGRRGK